MKALDAIRKTIHPALEDDFELENLLVHRVYSLGIPLNDLKGKSRDRLIVTILSPSPSTVNQWHDLLAIAQTVAILGEGMKISRELATAAQKATGYGR